MQFVANGPDVPDALLEAHEDGRVVFFCGAGISYPAGLPGFRGLVDAIYKLVGTTRSPIEQDAYGRGQYDATLDLLERRIPGKRLAVREALANSLQPNLRRKGASETHAALLQLARSRKGALRLVTTNFDRVFERLTARKKPPVAAYPAPSLPIPKNSRWDGIVYLHGLLPEHPDEAALNRLVLTSGDFGLAYLTERWAARFVSELFRNYVVCFVGYSINDPVLRYMMDALAADRMQGEMTPLAYALGDREPGQEKTKTIEWEAKGVVPILYEVPMATHDHAALHRTLKAWADTYRDGTLGKERIVVEYAMARPSASTLQDDFVGRMLWALSDDSGLPARRFADADPVPPLEWLEALSDDRYRHADLARFGVPPLSEANEKLGFSLILRPAPYTHAPWMKLVSQGALESDWDKAMLHLARWLVRHLDDPSLILWLAQRGGKLHDRFASLIEGSLDRLARLEQEDNKAEIDRIRAQAPRAIPRPVLRILWRLFLTDKVKRTGRDQDFYRWKERLKRDGLTATGRFELREMLAPKVALRRPLRRGSDDTQADASDRLNDLVNWELALAADDVPTALSDVATASQWRAALPGLVDDFQGLLRDALDLLREIGGADDRRDNSHWDLPSISPHWQNRDFHDWVVLIEQLRDAWVVVREIDPIRATRMGRAWFDVPYPTFKRLALFAASQAGDITPEQWVEWLTVDDAWWLWSIETRRETLRLLVLQGAHLSSQARARLEAAVLAGPPRAMFQGDIEPDRWKALDRSTWLLLAKLGSSGPELGPVARERLTALSAEHREWQLASNESDEFSHWTSGTGDPDFEASRQVDRAPQKRAEMVAWLKLPPAGQPPFYRDTWLETCRNRFFHCALALCDLAREGQWPVLRWGQALQAWSEEGRVLRSWRFIAPLIDHMPKGVLEECKDSVTWWLEAVAKVIDGHQDIFLALCDRVLTLSQEDWEDTDDVFSRAINHPVGRTTEALLNLWFRRPLSDGDGLPAELEPLFTRLCDTAVKRFRFGRVLLASRLIALFRVDRMWTEAHLVPLFDWAADPEEARIAWEGFLWSPRLYGPLLIHLKSEFLDTARHYTELRKRAQEFAAFLTYAALDPPEAYTAQDFQAAFEALPEQGLRSAAQALIQALTGAGEQREDYWLNRIRPFWQGVWPKSNQLASDEMAQLLSRLSISARGQFPEAVAAVLGWLRPIGHPHFIVHLLLKSGLSARFPVDALKLLNAIISDQSATALDLGECLAAMSQAAPALLDDPRYQRVAEHWRRHR